MVPSEVKTYYFLEGGGEMGELTRSFDWSQTPVGSYDQWPQSLRLTVGLILRSDFPMFLWWGDEMIQFYNDAYRPSFGESGKHPTALGQRAIECWPEIWDIIYPLIEQVKNTGQSFFSEDQLVPIYRNGKIEDVYWTFSYSAVLGESGTIDGVLVICNETTKKVNSIKEIQHKQKLIEQNEQNLNNIISQVNAGIAQTNINGRFQQANDRYCEITGYSVEELLSFNMLEITHPDDVPTNLALFEKCINQGINFFIEKRYIRKDGSVVWVNNSVSLVTNSSGGKFVTAIVIDITARKLQEERIQELLRSEQDSRREVEAERQKIIDLFMQAPAAIAVLGGPDHIFELANPRYMQLVGQGRHLIGKTIKEALPEIEGQGFIELLDGVYNSGKSFKGVEMPVMLDRKNDGNVEKAFVNFVYQPALNGKGSIDGILVHAVDVTDQVVARKKVEESEQRFRNLVNEAVVATAVYTGREMKIELVNDSMLKLWDKDQSVLGKTIREALPELDGQPFYDLLDHVFTTGNMYWGKEDRGDLIVNGEMKTSYFNFTYKPLRDTKGEIYGILNMAIDVTEQVLTREKIARSEANLRNIILQAPIAMCILKGPKHIVEIANERMFELWGRPASTVLNKSIFEGLPEIKNQGFEQLLNQVWETGETFAAYGLPITLPRTNTVETVYINFVYEAYRDTEGSISGIMVVASDVTQQIIARNKIEVVVAERTKELAIANESLQKSNAELSQFAYITSHDLQEPARKISTFIGMLNNSLGNNIDGRSRNYLDKIDRSATRMLTLIRDVLSFSQLTKEKQQFDKVDLNMILETIITDFELLIEQKQCIIESTPLPTIEAIPIQMSLLFGNLISNSLKFTRNGTKPHIIISSSILRHDEIKNLALMEDIQYYMLTFKDNGIGFHQENATQIFNIFQRLHGKSTYDGTGIGLAMCKKIAENHHGIINAVSSPGNGATFKVILPGLQNQ